MNYNLLIDNKMKVKKINKIKKSKLYSRPLFKVKDHNIKMDFLQRCFDQVKIVF